MRRLQLDLIACFMGGVQNVVAPQGTAFTADHARTLKRYVDEVVLCFDSDNAGQNAAVRSLDHLLTSGLAVRVAVVPAPHDPDSFIKAFGGAAFRQIVEKADGFFDYYLNRLCATNDVTADKGRLAVLHDMAAAVQKTGNGVLIDKYAQKTALRLGVSPESVRAEFKKAMLIRRAPAPEGEPETAAEAEAPRPAANELWLLKLLFLHDELMDWAATHLNADWIQNSLAREIVARRLQAHGRQTWNGLAAFLDEGGGGEAQNLVTEAATEDRPIPNPSQQLADVTTRLRNQFIDRQVQSLLLRMNQPDVTEAGRVEFLQEQRRLRELKRAPV